MRRARPNRADPAEMRAWRAGLGRIAPPLRRIGLLLALAGIALALAPAVPRLVAIAVVALAGLNLVAAAALQVASSPRT